MYRRIAIITVAAIAAGWTALGARDKATADSALERAWFAWDKGDYIPALTTYRTDEGRRQPHLLA
jgi:hypothetical protein